MRSRCVYERLVTTADTVKTIEDVAHQSGGRPPIQPSGAADRASNCHAAAGRRHRARSHGAGRARARRVGGGVRPHVRAVSEHADRRRGDPPIGNAAARRHAARRASTSDAVLLGAVGDPAFDRLPPDERPESGLLRLRTALGGFANLRPARTDPALIDATPYRRRAGRGRGRAGRPRAARRPVLRPAARLERERRVQHDALHARRDRPRRPRRLRAGAAAPPLRHLGRQGQRARDVAAVAQTP